MLLICRVGGGDTACGSGVIAGLENEKLRGSEKEILATSSSAAEIQMGGDSGGSGSRLKVNPDSAGEIKGSRSMRMFDTVVEPRGNTLVDGVVAAVVVVVLVVAVELDGGTVSSISRIRESAELAGEWLMLLGCWW
jgi:hypothetical protein